MISPEVIRRYPFFAGLSLDQVKVLAHTAHELELDEGHYFFRDGDELDQLYLILEGAVAILLETPDQEAAHSVGAQLMGDIETREVIVSTVGTGDIFGWSALMVPARSTAGAKTLTHCRVVGMNRAALLKAFEEDCEFGYLMMRKLAEVIRERLRDIRIESLAFVSTEAQNQG